ncbi:hypothetical protein HOLleu_10316 [Holothuria leucospilota]|uniref:Uncharacterized protein n=1 Tax=Holothuria leucospilota TaxID=206669 RepID=A0A9Q1CDH0_HOLLE|nr:hypothetical protein HOLleu_10316 [Holothuria leucospilota]
MKSLLVLLSCSVVLGLGQVAPQGPRCRVSGRESRRVEGVQSIPWEDESTNVLLRNDDIAESSVSEDPAGTREELTVPAKADFLRADFRPFSYYYHRNPCPTTVIYDSLTPAITVGGRPVTVLFPDRFQQIKCRNGNSSKCCGKCVQKYKYETALVRDRCRVRWDRVRVPSGCCCHYYLPYYYVAEFSEVSSLKKTL